MTGVVPQGDLLAIHTGARLSDSIDPFVCNEDIVQEMSQSQSCRLHVVLLIIASLWSIK